MQRKLGRAKAVQPLPNIEPGPATVLLALMGMSPAVLTETIWALAHEPDPILPGRIIVVTTRDARAQMESELFQPKRRFENRTPWDELRRALAEAGHNLDGKLRFGATSDDIRVITGCDPAAGRTLELADLRTPAENAAAADFLLEQVRALVENPDIRVVASIAGGRKTMGALLYACFTLLARETDRLTHVLVNDPFESLRGFWFPGQSGGAIQKSESRNSNSEALSASNTPLSTSSFDPAHARIELADVPFVPLRNLFHRELGRPAGCFGVLVESCREQVRRAVGERVMLSIEQSRCELEINGSRVKLSPREHLVMLFLASRAKRREFPIGAYIEAVDPLNEFREEVRAARPEHDFSDWRRGDALKARFDDDQDIRKCISSIRNKLRVSGGNAHLLSACLPEKGRFSLAVPAELIHLK
jgi:CRISPR-associated protein (TIGR02584 family)